MNELIKFYTVFVLTQFWITCISLFIASLGVAIKHPLTVFFWYLSQLSIVATIAACFVVGIVLILVRLVSMSIPKEVQHRGLTGFRCRKSFKYNSHQLLAS